MHDCEFGRLVFSNHSAKADSARHGTINIIANRLIAVSGKRQRLAVLQLTVNQFPGGKHWRFNSSLPHVSGSLPDRQEQAVTALLN